MIGSPFYRTSGIRLPYLSAKFCPTGCEEGKTQSALFVIIVRRYRSVAAAPGEETPYPPLGRDNRER
jgi:hypothetical protein